MGDTYLISGLTAKRAEVSGIIADLEKRIAQHRADLVHIDAVLHLCAPDVVPEEIAPKAVRKRNGWFGPGECTRLAYDAMRTAGEPLPTRTITEILMEAKGLEYADARTRELVQRTICGALNRASETERVERDGVVLWRLKD